MEIKQTVMKEVEEVVGYKCDICGKSIDVWLGIELNTVSYTILSGGFNSREARINKRVCSVGCFKGAIRRACFGAEVFLSSKTIDELVKML